MNPTPLRRFPVWSVLLVAALLVGCHSMTQTAGVTASLLKIALQEEANGGTAAVITLRLQSENVVGFAMERTRHRIQLDGVDLGEAVSDEPFAIARLGFATQEVTAHLRDPAVIARVRESLAHGRADYRIDSEFFLMVQEQKVTMVGTTRGTVDFRAAAGGAAETGGKN